jgi:hypothetical protein
MLYKLFENNATDDWPWIENIVTYANAKLSHALLLSGQWMQRGDMVEMGLRSLEWLKEIQFKDGHFSPIGNDGWFTKKGNRAMFDQQPIEAHAMIEACREAFNVTQEKKWNDIAVKCFRWFLGENDLKVSLYDPSTGGCRDGLTPDGANQNEGAESTLAWLLSLIELHQLYTVQILKEPAKTKKNS